MPIVIRETTSCLANGNRFLAFYFKTASVYRGMITLVYEREIAFKKSIVEEVNNQHGLISFAFLSADVN